MAIEHHVVALTALMRELAQVDERTRRDAELAIGVIETAKLWCERTVMTAERLKE